MVSVKYQDRLSKGAYDEVDSATVRGCMKHPPSINYNLTKYLICDCTFSLPFASSVLVHNSAPVTINGCCWGGAFVVVDGIKCVGL